MVILIGVLAMFGFTLTLPGIAGIVLTIGMAVDANVLIYERVREELAANKPLRTAIAAGYQRAFIVIFDSNFTTILTAAILIWLGSGPVKGFGVTLTIGLLANMFSAVFVTRWVFDWLVAKGWMKSFNMLHVFRHIPHINFLGVWKIAFTLSWVLIIAGMISFVNRGGLDIGKGKVYGIDFAGGDTVTMSFVQRVDADKLRNALNAAGFSESYIQYQRNLTGGSEVLSIKLPEGAADKVVPELQKDFPEAQLKAHWHRAGRRGGRQGTAQTGLVGRGGVPDRDYDLRGVPLRGVFLRPRRADFVDSRRADDDRLVLSDGPDVFHARWWPRC